MKNIKRMPLCNNNPSSAPHINGKCFFLCWRCTGAVLGIFLLLCLSFICHYRYTLKLELFLLVLPAFFDYYLIKLKIMKANNFRRFVTGMPLGFFITIILLSLLNKCHY